MPDVVALGDINVDITARLNRFPEEGADALAHAHEFHPGGSAANTALALAWLGRPVRLIARIGCDPLAAFALRELERAGVLSDGLQRDPGLMTGLMYIVVTPGGERTIFGCRGANAATDPNQVEERLIGDARHLHVSGYALLADPQRSAALRAVELARGRGLHVSLDPGLTLSPRVLEDVRSLLPAISILLPTLAEAQALTGQGEPRACASSLLDRGLGAVALKLGAAGCLVAADEMLVQVPGFCVDVRDSTGAGDSFAAGILAGRLGGLDWPSAALLANAMGAVAATRVGSGTSRPMTGKVLGLLTATRAEHSLAGFAEANARAIELVQAVPCKPDEERDP